MSEFNHSQTQPSVKKFVTDIFGDSDDDDDAQLKQKTKDNVADNDSDDEDGIFSSKKVSTSGDKDLFGDSDSEEDFKPNRKKLGTANKAVADDFLDSDEEDVAVSSSNAIDSDDDGITAPIYKIGGKGKKKRKIEKEKRIKKKVKLTKRSSRTSSSGSIKREVAEIVSSGDEYDSGEEVKRTKDDDAFVSEDEDDLMKGVMKEYEQDEQNFDDERPDEYHEDDYRKRKDDSYAKDQKESDPFTKTLQNMKKQKVKPLTDQEKDIFINKLQHRMRLAVKLDDECIKRGEPALNKMKYLEKVKTAIAMKPLQEMMLEKDILVNLRDWIEPRSKSCLPALPIRVAVYDMLLNQLPIATEHLKRVVDDKPPIGVTIVKLRKHKYETPENKKVLKDIMEKWSRPVFNKSSQASRHDWNHASKDVEEALRQKYALSQAAEKELSIDELLQGKKSESINAEFTRARTPANNGLFMFTVRPEVRNIPKVDVIEKKFGEGRTKLFKELTRSKVAKTMGVKKNPRAVDMKI